MAKESKATQARRVLNPQSGPPWLIAFHEAGQLIYAYDHHGAGISLLRAYAMHREAWQLWRADSQAQAAEAEALARPMPPGAWNMTNGRQLEAQREYILARLDGTINGLIAELENSAPGRNDAQRLADFRKCLHSGMGRLPLNARTQELRWVAAAAVQKELADGAIKSEAYRRVARRFGLESEFVKRAWVALRDPKDAALGARPARVRPRTGGDRKGDFRRAKLSGR